MDINIKEQLQQKEFEALKGKTRVILKWATGVGKSKMAIDLANYVVGLHSSKIKVLFVVAERAHMKNWRVEFQKWGLMDKCMDITMICYHSLHKMEGEHFDFAVFDEAHHAFTEKRKEILKTMHIHYIIMLSATLSYQKEMEIGEIFGKFTTSTVTLKEAVSSNILPDPRVYVLKMSLDDTVADQEIKTGEGNNLPEVSWANRKQYLFRKVPCIIKCTARQKYNYLTEMMEYWKQRYERSHNQFQHNRWVNIGSQRKRFLGELKTSAVRDIIEAFPKDKRFICFCASVAQANELSTDSTISSKRSSKLNQQVIDAFNDKKLHRIYAVGMANEGLNLTEIQAGIIVQLDGKERLFIQQFGRSLRAEDPVAYIFCFEHTQDEKYLSTALENIDEKFIKFIKI